MASVRLKDDTSFWLARFTDAEGKKRERSTGTRDRRQAQKIADAYEAAARRKFTVAHVQRTLRELMTDSSAAPVPGSTVAEFFQGYLERRRGEVAPATLLSFGSLSRRFLTWAAGSLPAGTKTEMSAIEPAHVQAFRSFLLERLSSTTVDHNVKLLRHFFEQARALSLILENPCVILGRLKRAPAAEIRPFSIEEVHSILAACGTDAEWRRLVLFGFYTGQRLGDLALLEWRNVNLDRAEISFVMRKTGKRIVVPLSAPLLVDLASTSALDRLGPLHPRAHALVSTQGRVVSVSNGFYGLLVRAGLAPVRTHASRQCGAQRVRHPLCFHSFRHTATSMLRDAGAPVGVSMELIGHSSKVIHQHYSHLGVDTLRRGVSLLPTL